MYSHNAVKREEESAQISFIILYTIEFEEESERERYAEMYSN